MLGFTCQRSHGETLPIASTAVTTHPVPVELVPVAVFQVGCVTQTA